MRGLRSGWDGSYARGVLDVLATLRRSLWRSQAAELSGLRLGATGSGKSEAALVDLVRLARREDHAVVLLDGHGPLALRAAGHWVAGGHEHRLVYEPLAATDRVLCWDMLPRSTAPAGARRRLEDAEIRDEVAQCFLAQRHLDTLNDRPLTRDWLEAAVALAQSQPRPEPLASLADAFSVGSAGYERLLRDGDDPAVVRKFRDAERLKRRSDVQYEAQTGAARRLVEQVCASEVVRLRCRAGRFDWLDALRARKLVALDGGGLRSRELKRTLFLLAALQVTHAVRRHFAQAQEPLPVVLVLEEAGALRLVAPFVVQAIQELRKAGLATQVVTQSSLDFGDRASFESLLANLPVQCWFQALAPADQEIGAKALANATFDARRVHYRRARVLPAGRVPGPGFIPRPFPHYTRVEDEFYASPQLHEQEYRTRLATLRVGECLVRDRAGVRRLRIRPLPPPWGRDSDARTRAAIARVRSRPLYLPAPAEEPPRATPPSAATRLTAQADERHDAGTAAPDTDPPPGGPAGCPPDRRR